MTADTLIEVGANPNITFDRAAEQTQVFRPSPARLIGWLVASLILALAVASMAAEAPARKVYRIGILGERASDPSEARLWQGFRAELESRGWIEGKNVLIESRLG